MGNKGDKYTKDAQSAANHVLENLDGMESISSKKMFGGHGLFQDGKMFGMINSKGEIFFKTNETNEQDYTAANSQKHSKMPYYAVPEQVLDEKESLNAWAAKAIMASKK